jgi:lysophospholipase L1-like esterase
MSDPLPQGLPDELVFLACSGAKISEVEEKQLPVLEDLIADDHLEVDLVLLSVGGNDSLFGTIGRVCLLPTDCTEIGTAWTANLTTVQERLDAFYPEVRRVVGDAPVVVVPYPIPLHPERCSYSALSDDEHAFLHAFTNQLDKVVSQAATDAGFFVLDTIPDSLQDRRLCDPPLDPARGYDAADAAVNFLAANSVLGTLEQSLSPVNWFHNSLHPNRTGHELMRATVLEWLETHDLSKPPPAESPLADREVEMPSDLGTDCQDKKASDLETCSWEWAGTSLRGFLLVWYPALLIALAGMSLVALKVVQLWRSISS